jgi:hypothetical protein
MPPFFTKPRKALKNKCLGFLASRNMKRITPCSVVPPQVSFAANVYEIRRNSASAHNSVVVSDSQHHAPKAEAEPLPRMQRSCIRFSCRQPAKRLHMLRIFEFSCDSSSQQSGHKCYEMIGMTGCHQRHLSTQRTNGCPSKKPWTTPASLAQHRISCSIQYHALFTVICSIYLTQIHILFHWNSGPHGAAWMKFFHYLFRSLSLKESNKKTQKNAMARPAWGKL